MSDKGDESIKINSYFIFCFISVIYNFTKAIWETDYTSGIRMIKKKVKLTF